MKRTERKVVTAVDLLEAVYGWAEKGAGRAQLTISVDSTGDDDIPERVSCMVELTDGKIVAAQTDSAEDDLASVLKRMETQLP